MTIDWDKPYKTRDGRQVLIYTRSSRVGNYPVRGEVESHSGDAWNSIAWHSDGAWGSEGHETVDDLVNVPQKHTYQINVYPDAGPGSVRVSYKAHPDKASAEEHAKHGRIACFEHTFTEGEGLDRHDE